MRSDKVLMAVSTFTRLFTSLLIFVISARALGPQQFGIFAGAMAYSMLFNLLTDFGLVAYALRLSGVEPKEASRIVRRALLIKAGATLIGILVCGCLWVLGIGKHGQLVVIGMIFAAMTASSFADIAFVAVRATQNFAVESTCVVWTNAVQLALVTAAAFNGSLGAITGALLLGRVIYLVGVAFTLRRWLFTLEPWPLDPRGLIAMSRGAVPYAVDGALTNLSNQIDVVMITVLMDPASVGIYQAGARLVQSISPVAVILSTVYLPKLSHADHSGNKRLMRLLSIRLNLEFAGLALLGYLGFLLCGPLWTSYILGPEYERLRVLWPGFASFVAIRFFNAGLGLPLAAIGDMSWRILAQIFALIIIVVSLSILKDSLTISHVVWTVVAANAALSGIYTVGLASGRRR